VTGSAYLYSLFADRVPAMRDRRHVEIVPLSTGCLGACTYCKTKHARGHLGSYDPEVLVQRVRLAAQDPEASEEGEEEEGGGGGGWERRGEERRRRVRTHSPPPAQTSFFPREIWLSSEGTHAHHPLTHTHTHTHTQIREIWLSSEDTGAYGRDLGSNSASLLRSMVSVLPRDGSVMLRLGE
jgi:hypothetical protein